MDPTLEAQLMAYLASEPAFQAEYNRVRSSGDERSAAEWIYDHIQSSPDDQSKFGEFVAADTAGVGEGDVPLEQAILDTALPGLWEDIEGDEARRLRAAALTAQSQGDYDTARALIARATSGAQLQTELGAVDETAASRRSALESAVADLRAAQDPLSAARLAEAEGAVTGVNLGLERTLDDLAAERAQQGYVGSSSMDTAAAARAAIGARQAGAQLVGGARTANATDERQIGAFGANERYGIEGTRATDRQNFTTSDYGRSLQAALSVPQLTSSFLTLEDQIGATRNAGLNRTLNTLNWWGSNAAAPTAGYANTTADTFGNDIAGLGAGLTSAALNVGQSNNWWRTPTASDSASVMRANGAPAAVATRYGT